jgi:hypothetical protein
MNNQVPKYVTCGRAALLLGIPEEELSRISTQSGLGHTECAGDETETFFTYDELRQICLISTHQVNCRIITWRRGLKSDFPPAPPQQ